MNSSNNSENTLSLHVPPSISSSNILEINRSKNLTELNTTPKLNVKKKTSIVRMRFTPQEDNEILRLVSFYGDKDWNKISSELSKNSNNFIQKTPRQCRDRYVNYLSPNIKKGEWTLEEDQCLVYNFVMSLFNLKSLKQLLPGRSEVAIKNRIKHLSKFGINIIKSSINNNLQGSNTNESNLQNININNFLSNNNFHISFGQFYSNQVKSVVTDIFHNSPLVLTAIKDNHLIINNNNQNQSNQNDTHTEEIYNSISESSQFESENDSFDPLYWIDMYM